MSNMIEDAIDLVILIVLLGIAIAVGVTSIVNENREVNSITEVYDKSAKKSEKGVEYGEASTYSEILGVYTVDEMKAIVESNDTIELTGAEIESKINNWYAALDNKQDWAFAGNINNLRFTVIKVLGKYEVAVLLDKNAIREGVDSFDSGYPQLYSFEEDGSVKALGE